jgi:hypothetical protein
MAHLAGAWLASPVMSERALVVALVVAGYEAMCTQALRVLAEQMGEIHGIVVSEVQDMRRPRPAGAGQVV